MYAIAGVSGQTGAAVADALLAADEKIRVIVRRPEAGAVWAARGAEVAVADLADVAALSAALRGSAGAFLLNPPAYAVADPFAAAVRQGEVFAAAIAASSVPRVVVLSSIGAQHPSGSGIIQTTHSVEQALRATATPVAFLRAAYFVENWANVLPAVRSDGVLPSFLAPLERAFPMVAVADIGAAAAELLRGPAWQARRVVELAGPSEVTPAQVAAAFGQALGHPVSALAVPREQWSGILAAAGFSPRLIEAFVAMYDGILSGHVAAEPGNEHRRGRTPIEDSVRGLLG